MKSERPDTRFRVLDSFRGIAAAIVVFEHVCMTIPQGVRERHPDIDFALSVTGAGRFSVMLFFVLSGFVLALPYAMQKDLPYGPYLIRRFFRLYLPYAFAIFLAAILYAKAMGGAEYVTLSILISHLLMTGAGEESTRLDGPLWSLIIEMRVSLIFPLLVMAVRRFGWVAVGIGVVGGYSCYLLNITRGATGEERGHYGNDAWGSLLLTLRYIPFFLLGIIASLRLKQFVRITTALPPAAHIVFCMSAFAFHVAYIKWGLDDQNYSDILYGVTAAYLIVCAMAFPFVARQFGGPVFLWLGDISYSLYLIHLPVLYTVLIVLTRYVSYPAAIMCATPIILLSATATYYVIERPSKRLGRKLSRRFL